MVKQLIAALVGALIGVALMIVLERSLGQEFGWTVIPIGILTGLGARWAAQKPNFLRGALAAVLALACFVGGKLGASYVSQQAAAQPQAIVSTEGRVDEAEDEEPEVEVAVVESQVDPDDLGSTAPLQNLNLDTPTDSSTLDTIWLVVGAALAYFIGRSAPAGPPTTEPVEATTEPSDDSPGE